MTGRERFLAACYAQPVDKTPIWFMRQAGRYLPEYQALKKNYSFIELAQTPALAAEVTLQPIKRFDLDAAIIFSDILVIPEALGQPYRFKETKGIELTFRLQTPADLQKLSANGLCSKLSYVADAIKIVRSTLKTEKALIGFAGSPWTLATYMIEGGAPTPFSNVYQWLQNWPTEFEILMELLTQSLIDYLKMQIAAGVDTIQIFDSWAAATGETAYTHLSLRWIKKIIQALPTEIPVILYAKGMDQLITDCYAAGVQVFSADHFCSLADLRPKVPHFKALQGNLNPELLNESSSEPMLQATRVILDQMRGFNGHIFNLGHGILPQARIEHVEALISYVHQYR
jgi:uroporphyrinogen decarboxylase